MYAVCKVECEKPLRKDIFLVETPMDSQLDWTVYLSNCSVFFCHWWEQLQSAGLQWDLQRHQHPTDTVIAKVFPTYTVTVTPDAWTEPKTIDPKVFKFGHSPISADWEKRLREKLAEHRNVFSLEEWEVGWAKYVKHNIRLWQWQPTN